MIKTSTATIKENDIIWGVAKTDHSQYEGATSEADLLTKANAKKDSDKKVDFWTTRGGKNDWSKPVALISATSTLKFPFEGDSVTEGIKVSGPSYPGINLNDVISCVAQTDHNGMKRVSSMSDLLSKANSRKSGNRVAVYNETSQRWVTVTLVPNVPKPKFPLAAKLGTLKKGSGGLEVVVPFHSKLKKGDILDVVSIPNNSEYLSGRGVTGVATMEELEAALKQRADTTDRVAVHYKSCRRRFFYHTDEFFRYHLREITPGKSLANEPKHEIPTNST